LNLGEKYSSTFKYLKGCVGTLDHEEMTRLVCLCCVWNVISKKHCSGGQSG